MEKRINEKFYHICIQYNSTQSASVQIINSGTHFGEIIYHLYQRLFPKNNSDVHYIFNIKQFFSLMIENLSLFINVEHTAQQLINQLANYENKRCRMIVLSKEALFIATFIARQLKTGIMFMPAETLKDTVAPLNSMNAPTIDHKTIQSLSPDVSRNSMCHSAPTIQYPETSRGLVSMSRERYVILVCGNTKSSDRVIGFVKSIQRQKPRRVVAVIPTLTLEAALKINREVDDLVFNQVVSEAVIDNVYPEFNTIADTRAYPFERDAMNNVLKIEYLNEN